MEFEEAYRKYFNDVYLYVRRLSGDEHIAEEITSDTFYKALYQTKPEITEHGVPSNTGLSYSSSPGLEFHKNHP